MKNGIRREVEFIYLSPFIGPTKAQPELHAMRA
jgi:hypothetical protein